MKKIFVSVCILLLSTAAFSQYKKASFFTKDGRVYELGAANHLFSDHAGANPISIFYSTSLENEKNGGFLFEIEYIPKSQLKYAGTYYNSTNQKVQGDIYASRGNILSLKYGYQYRFINKQNEESKLEPYLRAAFFYGYKFGSSSISDKNGNDISLPEPYLVGKGGAYGLEGGAGLTYYFSKKIGLRAGAIYQYSLYKNGERPSADVHNTYMRHPGFTIGLKYRIMDED